MPEVLPGGSPQARGLAIGTVAAELLRLDPSGDRVARVVRDTLDQLLDGRRSGRWSYSELHKTEKTYMGTLIEINLHREFEFADGDVTDYRIADIDVDCKFSQDIGGWEFGPELVGHLALVVWASDQDSAWRAGLVRAKSGALRESRNRDAKRKLTREGVDQIRWLWAGHPGLAPNQLLHMSAAQRDRVFHARGRTRTRHGQARLLQLCRELQGVILRRTTIETVGWGLDDPMKRMRSNGGAREMLRPEGLLVLGHQDSDPAVAAALSLPVPDKGQFVVCRVVPSENSAGAEIEGARWRRATPDDPVVPAPIVPR
ncbi:NaeI family type II restriction endonuclease [Kribbella sp.]|uniref:NaeI family type II restriction endonuclease n=1 Tax=Kribbella sp. TaxID=1871183 RepID=UPI002D40C100|nr:NaeI family type II restriction endonuclease [Kribbella sp.]HZX02251.1 NaeI family type II restriction endonuclease [Kribbella sp.]